MHAMRNRLAHVYFSIDERLLWPVRASVPNRLIYTSVFQLHPYVSMKIRALTDDVEGHNQITAKTGNRTGNQLGTESAKYREIPYTTVAVSH
jgi:hypothetical protein